MVGEQFHPCPVSFSNFFRDYPCPGLPHFPLRMAPGVQNLCTISAWRYNSGQLDLGYSLTEYMLEYMLEYDRCQLVHVFFVTNHRSKMITVQSVWHIIIRKRCIIYVGTRIQWFLTYTLSANTHIVSIIKAVAEFYYSLTI